MSVFTYYNGRVEQLQQTLWFKNPKLCTVWLLTEKVADSDSKHMAPEREKQISYINTYMWNLEKWYK